MKHKTNSIVKKPRKDTPVSSKNQQMHLEKGFTMKESNYKDFMAQVPVHGIKVPISSKAINEFFELPDFENDEYSSLISNIKPENLQEILEKLTVLGSKWTVSKQGTHTCRRESLTPLTKQVEESDDPDEEEEDPIEIEPIQSAEVPNKVEPIEPEIEPDDETSIFRAQPPSLDP
ncbi:hypothetical protein PVK06_030356 [Gossypium arboreum]|uniref:Uncharacterized protein n=1 Tax=Gossypium arboreum TaxID=29729 RepID=A0ABR0NN23_GOSAR|nr:hypothetical protein PVK06_030356 [Gossypium arboreum]